MIEWNISRQEAGVITARKIDKLKHISQPLINIEFPRFTSVMLGDVIVTKAEIERNRKYFQYFFRVSTIEVGDGVLYCKIEFYTRLKIIKNIWRQEVSEGVFFRVGNAKPN